MGFPKAFNPGTGGCQGSPTVIRRKKTSQQLPSQSLIDIYWEPQSLALLSKRKQIWIYTIIGEILVSSVASQKKEYMDLSRIRITNTVLRISVQTIYFSMEKF